MYVIIHTLWYNNFYKKTEKMNYNFIKYVKEISSNKINSNVAIFSKRPSKSVLLDSHYSQAFPLVVYCQ